MSIKYTEPHSIKPKLLAWSEVNLNEAETLINLFQSQSSHDCYCYLERIFDLNNSRFREKILLDMHYFALKYAVESNFTKIQVSSFISIIRALHKSNQETPFENKDFIEQYFQGLIICHSIDRPPFCIKIFDNQAAAKVIYYITNTYLKHYKLYKYAFTPIVGINMKFKYSNQKEQVVSLKQNSSDYYDYYPELNSPKSKELNNAEAEADLKPIMMPEPSSIPTMSSFSSSEVEMKNYVRQFLIDELDSIPIREKLSELEEECFRNKHNIV